MDLIRLTESGPSLKYAALYVAEDLGYLKGEGITIRTDIDDGPGGSWLVENLIDDSADIALGGIWMPLMYRQSRLGGFTPFAALCHRNAALILGRHESGAPFSWSDLFGKRVLLSMSATSQWMFLEGLLQEQGIDTHKIKFVRDLHSRTTTSLWRAGYADYYFVDPLDGETLIDEGAVIAGEMAVLGGPVPWSIVYAKDATMERSDKLVQRFLRALERGQVWLHDAAPAEVSELLARRFTSSSPEHIERVVVRLIASGVWQKDLRLSKAPVARYQDMMLAYGLFDEPADLTAIGIDR
ncbi:MAG: ABC transporter substrate-binding protein [Novosphingobium sp.]